MAFGTGSAVAHRAVDSIMGPRTIQHETVGAAAPDAATTSSVSDACVNHSKAFTDVCLFISLYAFVLICCHPYIICNTWNINLLLRKSKDVVNHASKCLK